MGPVEVLVVGFPGNRFKGEILPELASLVDRKLIAVIDCVLILKDADGNVTFAEIQQDDADENVAKLASLMSDTHDLLSEEDVQELAAGLPDNSSAGLLVFEHIWAQPLRDAIVDAGGVLAANFRIPAPVVDELLAALDEA
jgi:Family of unknown function (DUF6325)